MKLEYFSKTFKPIVDKEVKKILYSKKNDNLYRGMFYAVDSGKRLRPILCLTTCKLLGGDVKKALPFAAVIETLHNYTLVHDDIEDGDSLRRNLLTVWKKFGLAHGVNIGDGMIFKSYGYLLDSLDFLPSEKVLEVVSMLNDTMMKIVEGQGMEFDFRERDDITVNEYEEMVYKKSGALFSLSLFGGAFFAGVSKNIQDKLIEFGKNLGLAFQISDDILNLTGNQKEYGKEIGGDIKEGKRTLVTIHCLGKCNDDERKRFLSILKKGRENVGNNDVDFAMNLINKYNSIQFAKEFLEKAVRKSKRLLDDIDNEDLKDILNKLLEFIQNRKY